jgi:hypothetical protein
MFAVEQRAAGKVGLLAAVRGFRNSVHTEMLQARAGARSP